MLTIGVVIVMALIALLGITQSVAVAAVITVIEIAGLAFVIYWGFGVATPSGVTIAQMVPPLVGPHWLGVGTASLLAFFAFVGFEDMANVAEEVKDPTRTMPKAIIWTLVLATIIYVAAMIAVLLAVPLDELAASAAPLALVFEGASPRIQQGFAVIAVVATINGVLIQMIMASRVLYGLAARGHLPAAFAKVSQQTRTPVVATLCVAAIIMVLTRTLPIAALAARTSQVVLMIFVLVNLSLIRIKHRAPPEADYFKVPIIGQLTHNFLLLWIIKWHGLLIMSCLFSLWF